MNRRSVLMRVAATFAALLLPTAAGHAAEVKVLTSVALKSVLDELSPAFEKKTGGEHADLIILTRGMMEDLAKQNKLAAGDIVNIAGTPVAVAARADAPKPDIGTVDAFKQALLSARSIVYADPAKGGLSGIVAARAIERLGIAEQLKAKTILVPGAQSGDVVAKGEAELGHCPSVRDRPRRGHRTRRTAAG